jgi:hypothetical protein
MEDAMIVLDPTQQPLADDAAPFAQARPMKAILRRIGTPSS